MHNKIKELLQFGTVGASVEIKGWIRTKRANKQVVFLTINDGSCQQSLQVVMAPSKLPKTLLNQLTTGASIAISGSLVASAGTRQSVELHGDQLTLLGNAPDYPLQPKSHSLEFLRTWVHLRFRTNTFGAVFRIRHAISYAIHHFFHERGFCYLHTPIITAADAEGAGELFRVTSLALNHTDGPVDFSKEFFNRPTNLTVSGQLAAEAAAMGLGAVYTFGPTFRAENSNTSRHLAEFWMVEPEVAFNNLDDNIALAEALLKFLLDYVLKKCPAELEFLNQRLLHNNAQSATPSMALLERLQFVLEQPFVRITYTEAISILMEAPPNQNGTFVYPITGWGMDLQSEHERYLVEHHFKRPIVVTDYPKDIKAFYMRQNDDGKTVAAMDVLFPGIGEIIGGSQREERIDYLKKAMQHSHIEDLNWYLDTRRFGTIPHSGFGLGLDRFVLFVTGMENIRDVIPFPRTPGHVAC
ncbi:MAG: asparagine--tRNA ligase [Candidatus Cardinium sp.]|uniref:asparagine--tRNA ligase n=1 Tax=Cardinium endosymbiont of Dermatophagoides farinae TaxID=2597823 RepID=UPI0011825666|nr:asparagine--tRNA ligase [Cardinium endosymbiont of Dermatophagoides farinae]TSJ81084.1 asparagine--tRNA ligase [Cardinium endosymbiont of Dermatophagoides farinae]UWW97122.1 MAG: asparagine--tRNA ligase [Candidatus Cardinium sp.]